MVEAKLLRKKLKNGLIVDKWDLVTIIEKQQADLKDADKYALELERLYEDAKAEIEALKSDNKALCDIIVRGEK